MKIDNRLFAIPAAPFAILAFVRFFWWVCGLDWNLDVVGAGFILSMGLLVGPFVTMALFAGDVSLGHLQIGKTKDSTHQ